MYQVDFIGPRVNLIHCERGQLNWKAEITVCSVPGRPGGSFGRLDELEDISIKTWQMGNTQCSRLIEYSRFWTLSVLYDPSWGEVRSVPGQHPGDRVNRVHTKP